MATTKKNMKAVPWAERHRPKHLGEVIGNTDAVRKLAEWLRDWDDVVLHGKTKEAPAQESWQKYAPAQENINARAALVSGPPGIGKTTTSVLVARCNPKYTVMEFNASDARSKTIIDNMSNSLAGNHTLKLGNSGGGGGGLERTVIIMDECDGMAGGDKGGTRALMQMIKTTKNPIICICNDRNDPGIRDLSQICYDIKFKRPDHLAVAKRIKHVMEGEGKRVDLHTIESVVEACGHDIRHIINQTQFFGSVSAHGGESQKDTQVMLSPFDAAARLFQSTGKKKNMPTMEKRMDMFYLDADLMPLMVQENYLRTFDKRPASSADEDLSKCAYAAELIATGDTMAMNWEVQSSAAVLGTIYPAFLTAEESFQRASFPLYLQKKAPITKATRIVSEMHSKIRGSTSCTIRDLATTSYHDVLYRRLVKPLQYGAAKDCAAALFGMGLTREFFTDQVVALRQSLNLEDHYKKVEGKVKTQLLQELTTLQQAAAPAPVKRKHEGGANKRKSKGPADGMDVDEGDEGGGDAGGGDEDGGGGAAKKKKTANTKKGKSGASSSAGSLGGWRQVKKVGSEGETASQLEHAEKKPLMIMKYLDGHTNAVRRQVHLKDILDPWVLF